jgi:hypothetical protein
MMQALSSLVNALLCLGQLFYKNAERASGQLLIRPQIQSGENGPAP